MKLDRETLNFGPIITNFLGNIAFFKIYLGLKNWFDSFYNLVEISDKYKKSRFFRKYRYTY